MHTTLIFGATGGIGSSIVKRLKEKNKLSFLSSRSETNLEILASETKSNFFAADVTVESEVEQTFSECKKLGEISAVALCVGSILLKPAHMTSAQDWQETITLNLTSAFYICKYAAKNMASGSVLLFSSGAAQIGLANHEAIAAAKAGVEGLVRSAAATYASRNLRFNAIAPGLVRTNLSAKLLASAAGEKASLALHGLNRIGEPEDISGLAVWLLSEESTWVTGQIFNIDGGLTSIKKVVSA